MHKQAHRAAQAAECAHEQDGFWKFHDALFADQKAWTDADFATYAKSSGLDADKLVQCVESGRHAATVDTDVEEGRKAGMGGTPGFYINGVVLTGAQPLGAFVDVIDAELARR
jgi:protein-disulfide isomerase